MLLKVLERFLNSISDATFWILIIFAIGVVLVSGIRWLIEFLVVEVKEKKDKTTEEEREER